MLEKFYKNLNKDPYKKVVFTEDNCFTLNDIELQSNYIHYKLLEDKSKYVAFYLTSNELVFSVVLGIIKNGQIPLPLPTSYGFNDAILLSNELEFDLIITNFDETTPNKKCILFTGQKKTDNFIRKKNEIIYSVYTSGSTGIPKKVLFTEENIEHIFNNIINKFRYNNQSKIIFSTPYTFDASVIEIFSLFMLNCEIFVPKYFESNSKKIVNVWKEIEINRISHYAVTPSQLELAIDMKFVNKNTNLKYILVGGEVFSIRLLNKLKPLMDKGIKIFNCYGPSEATIYTTIFNVSDNIYPKIPIGYALEGVDLKIKDSKNEGELLIGGLGLSNGYADKSNEKFIYIEGKKYYKTGDIVSKKNNLYFFKNRNDRQIKYNGVRVELESIENVVCGFDAVINAYAHYQDNKLYVICKTKYQIDEREILKRFASNIHPIIIFTEEFSFTQNGKLDIKNIISNNKLKKNTSDEVINEKIQKILFDFNVEKIEHLDSLDKIKFFVNVEEVLGITLDEEILQSINSMDKLFEYLNNSNVKVIRKNQNKLNNFESEGERISKEILYIFDNNEKQEKIIETLYLQKNYEEKEYNSLLYFDELLPEIEISKKIDFLKTKCDKIDILKFSLYKSNQKLYFKKKANKYYIGFVKTAPDYNTLQKIFKNIDYKVLFYMLYIEDEKKIRYVFSHHIMDLKSLGKISKILTSKKVSKEQVTYEQFIKISKKENIKYEYNEILKKIPSSIEIITKYEEKIQLIEYKNHSNHKNKYSILYYFFQDIMNKYNYEKITFSFIENLDYINCVNLDYVVGDVHSTMVSYIYKIDSELNFNKRIKNIISEYKNGLNIRDIIFDECLVNKNKGNKKWNDINFTANFIGEVRNLDSYINKLLTFKMHKRNIQIVTKDEKTYIIVFNEIFDDINNTNINSIENFKGE